MMKWRFTGLVNVPIKHHPTIGDAISNSYLKVMSKIPKTKTTFTNPWFIITISDIQRVGARWMRLPCLEGTCKFQSAAAHKDTDYPVG